MALGIRMPRRTSTGAVLFGVLCGFAFLAAWLLLYPTEPWEADGDIYDHLGASRNLVEGDGLSSDVVYPVTTTFDWGRRLPQPLLHRPPGFALLLAPALIATGLDPYRAPTAVRVLQLLLLALTAWAGLAGLHKRNAGFAGPAWLLLLLFSPLLGLAVSWGWVEVPCALVLLVLWLRLRDHNPCTAGPLQALLDGLLAGVLTLLRTDLTWVPLLWWLAAVLLYPRRYGFRSLPLRGYVVTACAVWLVTTLPWWIHVTLVAGSPFFNPLASTLQFDLGENWWEYPRLRGLVPESASGNLADNIVPALIKMRHGIRVFLETLGQWLPWPVWGGALVMGVGAWFHNLHHGRLRALGPIALLGLTLCGMILLYALISQEARHLLVLLPVLAWEIVLATAQRVRRLFPPRLVQVLVLTALAALSIAVAPPRPAGLEQRLAQARRQAPLVEALALEMQTWPPGPVFTDNAAACWLTGRAGVWRPWDEDVENVIRETVPGMREARWARMEQR